MTWIKIAVNAHYHEAQHFISVTKEISKHWHTKYPYAYIQNMKLINVTCISSSYVMIKIVLDHITMVSNFLHYFSDQQTLLEMVR